MPSGAVKCPDCTWVSDERLSTSNSESDEQFLKVIPDFVAEVRSSTDSLSKLKHKMEKTWMINGVRLGWLIDPYQEKGWIYRIDSKPDIIVGFEDIYLSGEDIMPGLEVPLEKLK